MYQSSNFCHFTPAFIITPIGQNFHPILPSKHVSECVPVFSNTNTCFQGVGQPNDDWDNSSVCTDDSRDSLQYSSSRNSSTCGSIAGDDNELEDIRKIPKRPENNPLYHSSRYKTEMCRQFYETGICEYNERCLFAHGKHELNNSLNRHRNYRTRVCTAFHQNGYCSFGSRCAFVHRKREPADILKSAVTALPKIPMPENPTSKSDSLQYFPSALLVRSTDRDMISEENLMPSQFIRSNYKRLPVFTNMTENWV